MANQKLNKAALEHLAGETSFDKLYQVFHGIYGHRYEVISLSQGLDAHDVQASHEDALLTALAGFRKGKGVFGHYLNVIIKNNLCKLKRETARRYDNEVLCPTTTSKDDGGNLFQVLDSGEDVEGQALETEISDKRSSLVAEIVGSVSTDPRMKNVCYGIMSGQSLHSAAKHYGVCHKTVKRKLSKMAGFYNHNEYGDLHDYFTT